LAGGGVDRDRADWAAALRTVDVRLGRAFAGLIALALASITGAAIAAPAKPLMGWDDLFAAPKPQPDARIAYGRDPLQVGDLFVPRGAPRGYVVMLHGGCWRTRIADLTIMNYIAADLRAHGLAVWNLEYRGADRPGGGYPGTFSDVAQGFD